MRSGMPGVGRLLLHELLGNDAGDVAAALVHRVGQLAHDPDARSAVDELDVLVGQQLAERPRGGAVLRPLARIGAAEHADSVELGWLGHTPLGSLGWSTGFVLV